jgi:hypothetical protein
MDSLDKFVQRRNARRYMVFGVEMPITYGPVQERAGISNRRHYAIHNASYAKHLAQDNLKCLKLMSKPELKGI